MKAPNWITNRSTYVHVLCCDPCDGGCRCKVERRSIKKTCRRPKTNLENDGNCDHIPCRCFNYLPYIDLAKLGNPKFLDEQSRVIHLDLCFCGICLLKMVFNI